ncbi:MAG: cbb3-type cytochrome oxidase assembly protein CcoS [Verrucomicrobiota bacterium]
MNAGLFLLIGGLIFLSGSALAAFWWAIKDGQLRDLRKAPLTIFDDDEPVGTPTDRFPSRK